MKKKQLLIMAALFCFMILLITNSDIRSLLAARAGLTLELNKSQLSQGEVMDIAVRGEIESLRNLRLEFNQQQYPIYTDRDGIIKTKIGISYWLQPGHYNLVLYVNEQPADSQSVEIVDGQFNSSYLTVSTQQEKIVNPGPKDKKLQTRRENDKKMLAAAVSSTSQNPLWERAFIWPVKGEISTSFGATRYVNGKLQSRHSGIDIAALEGTPLKAANSGIITLAANLLATGNTVIIDHGWGIYSSYSHLQQLMIKQGETVNKGQVIGTVGSTGFSTGPHLHWVIKINNTYVNPLVFINQPEEN